MLLFHRIPLNAARYTVAITRQGSDPSAPYAFAVNLYLKPARPKT